MKILFSLGAVAALALTAPADAAQRHHVQNHGQRVSAQRHARNAARYSVGHRFTRNYHYTSYNSLPRTYVTRYHLSPRYRYVYTDGYIYQIDPTTYAVTRVLSALGL